MIITINKQAHNCAENENLLNLLRSKGFDIAAPCGGGGTCGKCKVKIENAQAACAKEKPFLTAEEISSGVRLACMTKIFGGMSILYNNSGEILATGAKMSLNNAVKANKLVAAADIGTTTVVLALVDEESAEVLDAVSENNSQSAYGADVMTRIKNSSSDNNRQHELIVSQIENMLRLLADKNSVNIPKSLYISGNTTMMHLFFGSDCASLGYYPYDAVFLDSQRVNAKEIGMDLDIEVTSMPCIASFIGGDITAGVLSKPADCEKYILLVDLGTNAEIVLYNNEKYFASSAAAGPAFEGANIRCGTAAIAGAVCGFEILNDNKTGKESVKFLSINNVLPPTGICGSGLIDLTAELLRVGSIDITGLLLSERYELDGEIALYPEDVRELQLAKSAICSVIEILVKSAEIEYNDIKTVYLSGGFGSYINPHNAAAIGLIPKELAEKTCAAGNTSLEGCVLYASNENMREKAEDIAKKVKVLNLSDGEEFSERFIENMMFGEDS